MKKADWNFQAVLIALFILIGFVILIVVFSKI